MNEPSLQPVNQARQDLVKRFGPKEAERVLARALELQQQAESGGGESGALSVRDLEDVGREVGLREDFVRQAAAEIEAQPRPLRRSRLLGAPTRLELVATLPQALPLAAFEPLVEEIERTLGGGHRSVAGKTLSWRRLDIQNRDVTATITSREGVTRIRLMETLSNVAGGLFGGIIGGVGGGAGFGAGMPIGMVVFHSLTVALSIAGGVLVGSYLLARGIFVAIARRRERELEDLLERLLSVAEETAEQKRLEGSSEPA